MSDQIDFIISQYDEVRKYFPDAADNSLPNMMPFLRRGLKKLLGIIPQAVYDIALQHYIDSFEVPEEDPEEDPVPEEDPEEEPEEGTPSPETLDRLVELIQECIVLFAFYKRLPLNTAVLTEHGLQQQWNDSFRPLRSEDAVKYRNEILFLFHDSVESLISFLNGAAVSEWDSSPKKAEAQQTLFKDAWDLSQSVSIDDSARFFRIILPDLLIAHRILANEMGDALEDLRLAVHEDSVPETDIELLRECRFFCAFYAMSSACVRISQEDFPETLAAVPSSQDSRDAMSAYFSRQADTKLKLISKIKETVPDEQTSVSSVQQSTKGFSI